MSSVYGNILNEGKFKDKFIFSLYSKPIENCLELAKMAKTYEKAMKYIELAKKYYNKYPKELSKYKSIIDKCELEIKRKFGKVTEKAMTLKEEKIMLTKLKNEIKNLLKKYNSDLEFKKEIRKQFDELLNEDKEYYSNEFGKYAKSGVPPYIFKIEYEGKGEFEYTLCEENQSIKVIMCEGLNRMVKELEKMKEFKIIKFSTGDGDEGSIYGNWNIEK